MNAVLKFLKELVGKTMSEQEFFEETRGCFFYRHPYDVIVSPTQNTSIYQTYIDELEEPIYYIKVIEKGGEITVLDAWM